MVTDEMLFKMMIRSYAFMRRNPNSEQSGDLMTMKTKGFGSILDILCENDGISSSEIAQKANIRQQSASEAIFMLEKRGYIIRKPSENDKRVTLVYITDDGKLVGKELKERRTEAAREFFGCLTASEKESLYNILYKLQKRNN